MLMRRHILSTEEGFTLEEANYLVSDGMIEIFMLPHSAARPQLHRGKRPWRQR